MDHSEVVVSGGHTCDPDIVADAAAVGPALNVVERLQFGSREMPGNPEQVKFDPPYSQPPILVSLFKGFDISNAAGGRCLRAYTDVSSVTADGAHVNVGTWPDTTMYSAIATWMAIPASNRKLQTGLLEIPFGGLNTPVSFPRQFRSQPQVFYAFNKIDVGINWRIDLNVHTITTDGFDVEVRSWDSTTLNDAGVTWIAFPGHTPEIGVYTVHPVGEQKGSKGYITFREVYSEAPKVLIGLNRMDISSNHNARLMLNVSDVSNKGMHWEIVTWSDTLLDDIRVTFLVLGNAAP